MMLALHIFPRTSFLGSAELKAALPGAVCSLARCCLYCMEGLLLNPGGITTVRVIIKPSGRGLIATRRSCRRCVTHLKQNIYFAVINRLLSVVAMTYLEMAVLFKNNFDVIQIFGACGLHCLLRKQTLQQQLSVTPGTHGAFTNMTLQVSPCPEAE